MTERLTPEEYLQKLEAELSSKNVDVVEEKPVEPPVKTEEPAKQKQKKKKKRKKKNYLLRFAIFVVIVVGVIFTMHTSLFTVKNIEVMGNRFYTPAQVIEMSGLSTGKNLFFEVKTKPARDALLETPYISIAHVTKKIPATIKIELTERLEYATFLTDQGYVLIDNEGMVLSISDKKPELTLLEGMIIKTDEDGQGAIPGKPLEIEQAYLLTDTLKLLRAVESTDLYFSKVYISSALIRAYINDDYYCSGEPIEILNNVENIRAMIADQNSKGINKGIIRVGSEGYLSFSPKIE